MVVFGVNGSSSTVGGEGGGGATTVEATATSAAEAYAFALLVAEEEGLCGRRFTLPPRCLGMELFFSG